MALSHIYCNKFYFETFVVISVWLLLCHKSFEVLCVSALPIQGWHWRTETWLSEVASLQDGIRALAECRTQPLRWAIDHSSLLISDSSPYSNSLGWRTQGTSLHSRMKTPRLDDTWRKSLSTWTSEYQPSPGPTPPLYQKRSVGWFKFKSQEGRSHQSLNP